MFWGKTEKGRHKVLKLSFNKMKRRQNLSVDAVPRKSAGRLKCWTWIWLSCWIQAWIWMGDLPQENNMKWKTLPYPSLFQLHVLFLISFQADEQGSLYVCLLLSCCSGACYVLCFWGASVFGFSAVTHI